MRITALGDKKVEVITPNQMIKTFGVNVAYVMKNEKLYVNKEAFEEEVRKFEKYMTPKEIAEDMYRETRLIGNKKFQPTQFDKVNRAKDTRTI